MKRMFESATIKLTVWYLAAMMVISLSFSYFIYEASSSELGTRLGVVQTRLQALPPLGIGGDFDFSSLRERQLHMAQVNLFVGLFYANLAIFAFGGVGSYILARRTLRPIEESHEAQSRFTSDASHELRTPLAVMKSELEVALRDKQLSEQDMREILESNLEEVNRLSDLSHTLLQLSRHDFSEVEMKKISLTDIIKKAAHIHALDTKRINTTKVSKQMYIKGNEGSVTELLMIILDNALRYSPPDSTVKVSSAQKGSYVQVSISNEGKGISEEDLPHIFDRFYRGDKARGGGQKHGYGLGLSLAKKIADLHHADIEIQSGTDKLTTVKISFEKS